MKKTTLVVLTVLSMVSALFMVACSQQGTTATSAASSAEGDSASSAVEAETSEAVEAETSASEAAESSAEATQTASEAGASWDSLTSTSDHSLVAIHPSAISGELTTATCLSCHDYDEIAADFEGKLMSEGGKVVFNPHAGHVAFDCTDCHSVTEEPVLQCNSCHYIDVPDGWYNSTDDGKAKYMSPETIYGEMGYDVSGPSYNMDSSEEKEGAEYL